MALQYPIIRVNTTAEDASPDSKRTALTLKKYGLWNTQLRHPNRKKIKAFTSKRKAISLWENVFLICGPGVTCKFQRQIFSVEIKSFWKIKKGERDQDPETRREDHVRTRGRKQPSTSRGKRGYHEPQRNQCCGHLELGCPASRTVRDTFL